jgi:hypothetical protein
MNAQPTSIEAPKLRPSTTRISPPAVFGLRARVLMFVESITPGASASFEADIVDHNVEL